LVNELLAANDTPDDSLVSEIVEAVVVMIPFLFILTLGICCTCSVQSELKFDLEKRKNK